MPRIRTIKPEFWADEKLAPMRPIDRLVFISLWSMADDAGRLVDNIRQVNAFVFPATNDDASESLIALHRAGRIRRGTTKSGQNVIQILNWSHQKIDHPNLKAALPAIVKERPVPQAVTVPFANHSRETPGAFATLSVPVPVPVPATSTGTGTPEGSGLREDPNFGKVPTEKDRQARLDAAKRLGFKLDGAA